jgi:dynein heavy chain
MFPKEEKDAVL